MAILSNLEIIVVHIPLRFGESMVQRYEGRMKNEKTRNRKR